MTGVESKSTFLRSISPWSSSRSATPRPGAENRSEDNVQKTQGQDHAVSHKQRLSLLRYPKDCPPLQTRWFYAVDTPKFKPTFSGRERTETKPLPLPKKFVAFSLKDSQSVEAAFQQLLQHESLGDAAGASESTKDRESDTIKVPVNEDYLYDVDVDKRELSPAYWLGPVYEVRRGTWFFQEGSMLKPCEENLATQLEEGFLKLKPWLTQDQQSRPTSGTPGAVSIGESGKPSTHSRSISDASGFRQSNEAVSNPERVFDEAQATSGSQTLVYRLFGGYMNSTVTYQDSVTAWLNYDDFMSRMSSSVYQRFGGVGGTKVIRGYIEPGRTKDVADKKDISAKSPRPMGAPEGSLSMQEEDDQKRRKRRSAPDTLPSPNLEEHTPETRQNVSNVHRATLQRQMSSLNGETEDAAVLEEEARKQEEKEMEASREADDEERDRDIDHLVLVTHGIGQRLGLRLESINFIHDVNVLRNTMKSVYGASLDLQTLNSSFPDAKKNCRVQVLPVCWRHLLDFPRQGLRQNRKEFDLADAGSLSAEDEQYPSLADITLEGVPAVRNLISDLAMDVLLYQSAYREHIMGIVQQECNRIFALFKSRNPSFKGTVSLCGHSLGSAIMFDILCRQQRRPVADRHGELGSNKANDYPLDFDCKEFFCLGSPIALFQMLRAKTIAGRPSIQHDFVRGSRSLEADRETLTDISSSFPHSDDTRSRRDVPEYLFNVSSPDCEELYNIFHPSDPVSYRLEPLISPAMTSLKPQPLPFVKRSIWTTSGQSLSNISSRVGSLWTNFTSGVASSLLNRSLGLQSEDPAARPEHIQTTLDSDTSHERNARNSQNLNERVAQGDYPTLIDPELETLYEGFQKVRHDHAKDGFDDTEEAEERAKKLKYEEAKVRALNSNGRVDYSIQEGAFDISLIASIASHLAYWADEDVNHFMLSQMLSRMRKSRRK